MVWGLDKFLGAGAGKVAWQGLVKFYRLDEALREPGALREAAGLGQEMFPLDAFVEMISDQVEALRRSDEEIGELVRVGSGSGTG